MDKGLRVTFGKLHECGPIAVGIALSVGTICLTEEDRMPIVTAGVFLRQIRANIGSLRELGR